LQEKEGSSPMLNIQQVKSIMAQSHEELQDLINEDLRKLGNRVISVQFCQTLASAYGAHIVYWSQDIESTMTYKLETLPEEPMAEDGAALFVAVLHECQRDLVYRYLEQTKEDGRALILEEDLFDRTMARFAPDKEEQLE
jgi:hypothetical protein